jgi:hypothetical protein
MKKFLGRLLVAGALAALIGVPILARSAAADMGARCDQAISQAMAIDPRSDTVRPTDGSSPCDAVEAWVGAAMGNASIPAGA